MKAARNMERTEGPGVAAEPVDGDRRARAGYYASVVPTADEGVLPLLCYPWRTVPWSLYCTQSAILSRLHCGSNDVPATLHRSYVAVLGFLSPCKNRKKGQH